MKPFSWESIDIEEINKLTPTISKDFVSKLARLIEKEKHIFENPVDYDEIKTGIKKISGQTEKLISIIEEAHPFSLRFIQYEQVPVNHDHETSEVFSENKDITDFGILLAQLHDLSAAGRSYLSVKGKPGAPQKISETSFIGNVAWHWRRCFGEWPPLTEDSKFHETINYLLPRVGFKPVSFKKIIRPAIKLAKNKNPRM